MIVNALYDHYYSKKRKRGYEIVGWGWIFLFIAIIIIMGIVASQLIITGDWRLTIAFFVLFISLKVISRKTDIILDQASIQGTPQAKELILEFLHVKFKFEKPQPFIELANQLQKKAEESKKTVDLTPQINMILPVFVLLLSLMVQSSPETLPEVIVLAIVIMTVSLSITPTINTFSDIFLNTKYEKIMELSNLVREIYLDELAKEINYDKKPHEAVQVINTNVFLSINDISKY